jgi:hypothetical protein
MQFLHRAREMMLLMEGAMALMLIHGYRGYSTAAARPRHWFERPDAAR